MNPHSHDYRDTVRAGEKTGSAFQGFKPQRKAQPMLWITTAISVFAFLFLLCALPWEGGW